MPSLKTLQNGQTKLDHCELWSRKYKLMNFFLKKWNKKLISYKKTRKKYSDTVKKGRSKFGEFLSNLREITSNWLS